MRLLRYYLPAILWIILILVLCTLPGEDIPQTSFFDKVHMDKVVHFGLFAGTVLLLCLGYYQHKKHISPLTFFLITICVALYGLGIEFIQKYLVRDRSFDMNDVAADTLGAIVGIWAFKLIKRWFLDKKKPSGKPEGTYHTAYEKFEK